MTLCAAGAAAGITAGLFGNGGGFVVVPALVFVFTLLGDASADLIYVAIGTSLATIVISSARAVQAHSARGAVDFDMLKSWAGWLIIGVVVGFSNCVHQQRQTVVRVVRRRRVLLRHLFFVPHSDSHR